MPANHYNREFARQFRQDHILYPGTEERQVDHLRFRQFAGNKQELANLANHLSDLVHDVSLINRLVTFMQDEAMSNAACLVTYIEGVKKQFSEYADAEPYTATYYAHMMLALNDLEELAETFQNDISEHLLDKLQMAFAVASNNYLDIDSETICKIDDAIEYYLDNFEAYDNYFNGLIRQEQNQDKAVTVTSQVAYYLSKLVSFTDTFMLQLQSTREILFAWDIQLNNREMQELYN
jgi:hypothetical protein